MENPIIATMLKFLYYPLIIGLIVFCVIFACPVLSGHASSAVLESVGCTPAGFNNPYSCPYDSIIGERFGALSAWPISLMAFIFFPLIFWDVLLVWIFFIIILKVIIKKLEG